jgi:hypothetical protein
MNKVLEVDTEKKKLKLPKLIHTYKDHFPKLKPELLLWILHYLEGNKWTKLNQLLQSGIDIKLSFETTIAECLDARSLKRLKTNSTLDLRFGSKSHEGQMALPV